jgi:hypothetical protein
MPYVVELLRVVQQIIGFTIRLFNAFSILLIMNSSIGLSSSYLTFVFHECKSWRLHHKPQSVAHSQLELISDNHIIKLSLITPYEQSWFLIFRFLCLLAKPQYLFYYICYTFNAI